MECINPYYIKHGRIYSWKNPIDAQNNIIFPAQKIDCRHCIHCRKNRGKENADMCVLENAEHPSSYFITLTKKPEYEKEHPVYEKNEARNFTRRLRRWNRKNNNTEILVYRVHEHGKYGRSHYHFIVFSLMLHDVEQTPRPDTYYSATIQRLWPHGHITVQELNHATAMYQSLYLDKDLKNGHANSSKKSVSYHRGIGTSNFLKNYKQYFSLGYIPMGENKIKIPRKFMKIAQKHIDATTLTNEQYCWKYSRAHTKKILAGETTKLCTINIEPDYDMVLAYQHFKNQPRNEEKNNERMNQITNYIYGQRKLKPDFHLSGENTIYEQQNKLEKDRL